MSDCNKFEIVKKLLDLREQKNKIEAETSKTVIELVSAMSWQNIAEFDFWAAVTAYKIQNGSTIREAYDAVQLFTLKGE